MNRQRKILLLIADLFWLLGTIFVVSFLREGVDVEKVMFSLGTWFIAFSTIMFFYIFGAYDIDQSSSVKRIVGRAVIALVVGFGLVVVVNYFGGKDRAGIFGRGVLLGSFLLFGGISSFYRWMVVIWSQTTFRKSRWLFVCTETTMRYVKADLEKNPFQGQAFFVIENKPANSEADILGSWDELESIIQEKWSSIVVGLGQGTSGAVIESLVLARFENATVKDLTEFYEEIWRKVPLFHLESRWFLLTQGFNLLGNPIRQRIKRLMDVTLSTIFLVLTFPIMILAWIAIRLESSGPGIYKQIRTGRDGHEFVIYKFRSMKTDAEKAGVQWASENDSRITAVGKFIRKTRIDELPQLLNILQGKMSFVGPRPERPEFNGPLAEQIPFYHLRHLVHPGLTGWAQILYPYGASVEDSKEKLQYELYYIKNYSIWMDIGIVLKTAQVVLLGRGR